MVSPLPPLSLGEPNIELVDGSEIQQASKASDALANVREASARRSRNSGEHSVREADDIEPLRDQELQDRTFADAQGTDKESHLSVQRREDMAASTRGMASMVQQRPDGDGRAASQTGEPTVCGDPALGRAPVTGPLVPSKLNSKYIAGELQQADEIWARHAMSKSTKGQASGFKTFGTAQQHMAEVWRR